MQQARRKAQAQIVIGMSALAVSSVMLTRLHSNFDFYYGLGFGVGMGLLMLGIYTLKRQ
jgi:hypothetical protein